MRIQCDVEFRSPLHAASPPDKAPRVAGLRLGLGKG